MLCAGSTVLNFRADLNYVDSAIESELSEVVTLETQLDAPPAPANAPIVQAAESALIVRLESSDRSVANVDRHEVCVRRASNATAMEDQGAADAGTEAPNGNTLEDLRAGFSTCKETSQLKSGDYRYEGLENDVSYELVVAAYDSAGNRSPNSEIVRATPASLFDFAELYHSRLNGAEGETGGCSSAGSTDTAPLWILGILLIILRRRTVSWTIFTSMCRSTPWNRNGSGLNAMERWVVDLQFGTYKPRIDSQFQRGKTQQRRRMKKRSERVELLINLGAEQLTHVRFGSIGWPLCRLLEC